METIFKEVKSVIDSKRIEYNYPPVIINYCDVMEDNNDRVKTLFCKDSVIIQILLKDKESLLPKTETIINIVIFNRTKEERKEIRKFIFSNPKRNPNEPLVLF